MFQLKNTCKGWASMQAAIKKKKTVYHTVRIKIDGKSGDYYELVQALSVNDPRLTPTEVEGIKNFNKNDKENYQTPSGEVAWNALNIFIRQRLMKFPETGRPDSDAYERISFSEYNIYIDDEDKWDEFHRFFEEVLKEVKAITGRDVNIEFETQGNVGIPKAEPLMNELAYDRYGNKFEVGDFVARSRTDSAETFADVIIGTTEKSLRLLSGGNCYPESTFVIKKGNGQPASISY